ncbi:MAG: hypothetical protein K9H16_09340, partial [Bacteroidales bacterium]|nr:hypothetical protein [Bacteroidales bacterium]
MKKFVQKRMLFLLITWSFAFTVANAQDWVCVPESCSKAGYGNLSPIAFHPITGEPYKVASKYGVISVERYHEGVWEFLDVNMISSGYQLNYKETETASIAFHPTTNEPYVAFSQGTDGNQIIEVHVKRYTGGEWVSVGDKLNINTCEAKFPKIVFDTSSNEPYVAFSNIEDCDMYWTTQFIRVKRFDGNSWVEVGSSHLNQSREYWGDHCIAINPVTHKPWVTWSEDDGNIYIKKWNGNSWDRDGTFGGGEDPKIAFEPATGIPWLIRRVNGALNVHYKPGNWWNESIYDLTGNL